MLRQSSDLFDIPFLDLGPIRRRLNLYHLELSPHERWFLPFEGTLRFLHWATPLPTRQGLGSFDLRAELTARRRETSEGVDELKEDRRRARNYKRQAGGKTECGVHKMCAWQKYP